MRLRAIQRLNLAFHSAITIPERACLDGPGGVIAPAGTMGPEPKWPEFNP